MRLHELAKELGVSAKELMGKMKNHGLEVSSQMDVLDPDIVIKTRELLTSSTSASKHQKPSSPHTKMGGSEVIGKDILLDGVVTVQEFASLIGMPGTRIVSELIKMGKMMPLHMALDSETAEKLATKLGYNLIAVEEQVPEEPVDVSKLKIRPPVVTVMGHVDHGKTTLLDAIRTTQVAAREEGGITQHIGASWVDLPEGRIVFLDTPGHEAFTQLRARGAKVTDIVILIVAADDGIMPQTIEAINHAREADVPIIVAINKIDKPNADVDKVKKDLVQYDLVPEEWGGRTQMSLISAKNKQGIRELLEMVLVQAEIMDLKTEYDCPAEGIVIESRLDRGRGPVATVIIKKGTLRCGDALITGLHHGRVRALLDWNEASITDATPSTPVEILGLSGVPHAGDIFEVVDNDRIAKLQAQNRQQIQHEKAMARSSKISFDDLFSRLQTGNMKELKIVLKSDVQGSLEAIEESLTKMSGGSVKIKIIHSGIGAITDNDVMLASASDAVIIGFNVRPDANTRKLAAKEKIEIRTYRIIYELIEEIQSALEGMLEPEMQEVVLGHAEVRQIFQVPKVGPISGSYVTSGKILRSGSARLIRDGAIIWEGKITTLRRFKDDAKEVAQGFECGIALDNFHDIKIGDVIECFAIQEK